MLPSEFFWALFIYLNLLIEVGSVVDQDNNHPVVSVINVHSLEVLVMRMNEIGFNANFGRILDF
jgi:alpha-D-ribose 1-methylphosphonate 5-triphosphate synthase subunit PhnL